MDGFQKKRNVQWERKLLAYLNHLTRGFQCRTELLNLVSLTNIEGHCTRPCLKHWKTTKVILMQKLITQDAIGLISSFLQSSPCQQPPFHLQFQPAHHFDNLSHAHHWTRKIIPRLMEPSMQNTICFLLPIKSRVKFMHLRRWLNKML